MQLRCLSHRNDPGYEYFLLKRSGQRLHNAGEAVRRSGAQLKEARRQQNALTTAQAALGHEQALEM